MLEHISMLCAFLGLVGVVVTKVLTVRSLKAFKGQIRDVVGEVRQAQSRLHLAQAQTKAGAQEKLLTEQKLAKLEQKRHAAYKELKLLTEEAERRQAKRDQTEKTLSRNGLVAGVDARMSLTG